MPEGAKIERIEDLKPGDVLVLPSSEASKLPSGMACIPVDQDLILYENDRGHLVIPCLCAPDAGGMRVKLLGGAGLLQFFTLKSRSGGEVCPSEIVCSTQPKRKQIAPGEAITVGLTTISNPYPYPIWVSGFDRDGDGRPERVRFSSDLGEMQMVVSVGPVRASDSGFWGDNPPRIGQVAPPRMVSSDVDLEAYKAAIKSHRATFIDTQTETDWDATDGLGAGSPLAIGYTRLPVEDIAAGATIYVSGGWLNIRTLDGRVITSKQPIMLMPSAEGDSGLNPPPVKAPDPKPTVPDDVQVGPVDFLALNKEFSSK